jgi:hypothetical protein
LLGFPTLDLQQEYTQNNQKQISPQNSSRLAPRILQVHTMYPPNISIIEKEKGCCKYLQQALQESKSKMGERGEWERFWA